MGKYLIRNCDIADFNTLGTTRREILIDGSRISRIAEKIEPQLCEGATVIDAHGMLAVPGFADCHTHMTQTIMKGPMDDYPITQWLVRLFGIENIMTDEENYYATLLGCLTSLRYGTTTINEMAGWDAVDPMLQAIEDSGIRATFGISTTDVPENDATPILPLEESMRRTEIVYKKAHGRNGGLIRASVAPAGLPACSREMDVELKKFADERGLIFHTHLGEGKKETHDVMRKYGTRGEAEALYNFGLLDKHTLLAHSIWLEDFELDLIAETGANPVHCPCTNMKISDGIPKIAQMLKRGINVCIGCDGEASSSNRDMIREARTGAYLQKAVTLDPTVMDVGTTLKMMTVNGARALGYDDLGEIKEGNLADIVLVNMDDDISIINPDYRVSNLIYAANGSNVDTVFCQGRLMVRNKKLQNYDEEALLEKCREVICGLNKKIALL